jgi:hypothetical protein
MIRRLPQHADVIPVQNNESADEHSPLRAKGGIELNKERDALHATWKLVTNRGLILAVENVVKSVQLLRNRHFGATERAARGDLSMSSSLAIPSHLMPLDTPLRVLGLLFPTLHHVWHAQGRKDSVGRCQVCRKLQRAQLGPQFFHHKVAVEVGVEGSITRRKVAYYW